MVSQRLHLGMKNAFEPFPEIIISKNDSPQDVAVDIAAGTNHTIPENFHNLGFNDRGCQQFMNDRIG